MCLSLLYIDYRVKPNFQSAALGTIAVGLRVTNFQIFLHDRLLVIILISIKSNYYRDVTISVVLFLDKF